MLIPDVGNYRPPIIKSYDLITKKMNQAIYQFDDARRDLLWIRYNNEVSKTLYSNYGQGAFSLGARSSTSRLGVLNLKTLEAKNLIFKPEDTEWGEWTGPFPNWSSDNKHIIYGMAQISRDRGSVGSYDLYIKTNIEEEINLSLIHI